MKAAEARLREKLLGSTAAPRPPHLITITTLAKLLRRDRTTVARWAGQGRFGPLASWGSSVSLVDVNEASARGYDIAPPEPRQFTATDLRLAVAAALQEAHKGATEP